MGDFKDFCGELFGTYNNNLRKITTDSTERIFYLMKNPNYEIFFSKKIIIGNFYIIKYNYNGNKIWCPIFVIDDRYKPDIQKRIIYAINIDYLPYTYRILFFDILFNSFEKIVEFNINNPKNERPFKINFELIYGLLKRNGGYNYSITAFDYLKIDKLFFVSTSFVNRLLFINTKIVNIKNMKSHSLITSDKNIKNKLNDLIDLFEKINEDLDANDQRTYYMKLKNLEKKYKLYNND